MTSPMSLESMPVNSGCEMVSTRIVNVFIEIFNSVIECNKVKSFVTDKNEENFDSLENKLKKYYKVERAPCGLNALFSRAESFISSYSR